MGRAEWGMGSEEKCLLAVSKTTKSAADHAGYGEESQYDKRSSQQTADRPVQQLLLHAERVIGQPDNVDADDNADRGQAPGQAAISGERFVPPVWSIPAHRYVPLERGAMATVNAWRQSLQTVAIGRETFSNSNSGDGLAGARADQSSASIAPRPRQRVEYPTTGGCSLQIMNSKANLGAVLLPLCHVCTRPSLDSPLGRRARFATHDFGGHRCHRAEPVCPFARRSPMDDQTHSRDADLNKLSDRELSERLKQLQMAVRRHIDEISRRKAQRSGILKRKPIE